MTDQARSRRGPARTVGVVLAVVAIAGLAWFGRRSTEESAVRLVSVYAFTALQGALDEEVLPAFAARWRERTGQRVEITPTFAASGRLVERIVRETAVDVAILASAIDVERLRRGGIHVTGVGDDPAPAAVPARTPIAIGVAPGNPLGVRSLKDLRATTGRLLVGDPLTSGAGEWAILALYGAARADGADADGAAGALAETWRHVGDALPSARQASRAFEEGTGDVLVTYESEILRLQEAGVAIERILPPVTVMCEPVLVKLPGHVRPEDAVLVDALVEFLGGEEAERAFTRRGLRPRAGGRGEDAFPPLERALTLEDFGGPDAAERDVTRGAWREDVAAR